MIKTLASATAISVATLSGFALKAEAQGVPNTDPACEQGNNNGATIATALQCGSGSEASATNATAIGVGAIASAESSTAIGIR
ncbi:MAG: hypothetical protein HRT82_10620 [Henriciella sp.]|nr:hypothetical protein [Henriciella sp.]